MFMACSGCIRVMIATVIVIVVVIAIVIVIVIVVVVIVVLLYSIICEFTAGAVTLHIAASIYKCCSYPSGRSIGLIWVA